jgi:hypothetical protein
MEGAKPIPIDPGFWKEKDSGIKLFNRLNRLGPKTISLKNAKSIPVTLTPYEKF